MKIVSVNLAKKILSIIFIFLTACLKQESPVIYFSNVSPEPIKDIQCRWGRKFLNLPTLNPGDSRSQSFYISDSSDFFDTVSISWRRSTGEQLIREFSFRENNMPSIEDETTYNYVQFYLDQDEMEIVSSDAPDLPGKTRKMERLMSFYKSNYDKSHRNEPIKSSLVTISPQEFNKDRSVPLSILNSF